MNHLIIYQNHKGETVEVGGKYTDWNTIDHDLFDYLWSYDNEVLKTPIFFKEGKERFLHVGLWAKDETKGLELRNQFYDVVEADIDAQKPGRIIIGEYYLECFILGTEHTEWHFADHIMEANCTVLCENPTWIKEHRFEFLPEQKPEKTKFLRYKYRYPYNYHPSKPSRTFTNTARLSSAAKLIIYGYVENPSIYINGNLYQVNLEVDEGGRLEIDGKKKTVYLINRKGEIYSAYSFRNKGNVGGGQYIFEKIEPGFNEVSYAGEFGFDLILYEERSIPEWT